MLEIGVCSELHKPPFISNPLTVVDTGEKRLVLDVSLTIKVFSLYKHLNLGTLHSFTENIKKEDYMAMLDIKKAYYY